MISHSLMKLLQLFKMLMLFTQYLYEYVVNYLLGEICDRRKCTFFGAFRLTCMPLRTSGPRLLSAFDNADVDGLCAMMSSSFALSKAFFISFNVFPGAYTVGSLRLGWIFAFCSDLLGILMHLHKSTTHTPSPLFLSLLPHSLHPSPMPLDHL